MAESNTRIIIIDRPSLARQALETQIAVVEKRVDAVMTFDEPLKAVPNLNMLVKGIFIDILQYPLDNVIEFIGAVRNGYPWIVFVLWMDLTAYEESQHDLSEEWRRRFGHYFKLDKDVGTERFRQNLINMLNLVDMDFWSVMKDPVVSGLYDSDAKKPVFTHPPPDPVSGVELNKRLFISYSRADSLFVDWLWQQLSARKIATWLDRKDIEPGDVWDDKIHEALQECAAMLLIVSPTSMGSTNVSKEWKYYLSTSRLVIPLLLEECDLHFQLVDLQYADFRSDHTAALASLITTIENRLES